MFPRRFRWLSCWFVLSSVAATHGRAQIVEVESPAADEDAGAAAVEEATGTIADMEPCKRCEGDGKVECARCNGKRRVSENCSRCGATGTQVCASTGCVEGRKHCRPCGGSGKRTVRKVRGKKAESAARPCLNCSGRGSKSCTSCRGDGLKSCSLCRGRKQLRRWCTSCERQGEIECFTCRGAGTIARLVPGEPESRLDLRVVLLGVVGDSLEKGHELQLKVADLIAAQDDQKNRAATCRDILEIDLDELSAFSDVLQTRAKMLRIEWKKFARSFKGLTSRIERLATWREQAESRLQSMTYIKQQLTDSLEKPGRLIEGKVKGFEEFFGKYRTETLKAGSQVKRFESMLQSIENGRTRYREMHAHEAQKLEEERRERAAVRQAFARATTAFEAVAGGKLPRVKFELSTQESTSSGLCVEIHYLDREANAADRREDVVPTEKYTRTLPSLIAALLEASPDVERIRILVFGYRTGRTGKSERWEIQKFFTSRAFWDELQTGIHRGKWRELLASINPVPEYPRPGQIEKSSTPIILVIGICFLGVAVVLVARMRLSS